MANPGTDLPVSGPISQSFRACNNDPMDNNTLDPCNLTSLTTHYTHTVLSGRLPDLKLFH